VTTDPDPSAGELPRDLWVLARAVAIGGVAAALSVPLLTPLAAGVARDLAVSIGAAVSATAHARIAHAYPWRRVGLSVLLGTPLVYIVMQLVHLLLPLK
jgi:hypothetical protein